MWNKWQIIEKVIISQNEVKKTVIFKTCEPDSAPVFRRLPVYSFLHFPSWSKNGLNSVYNVLFDTQYSRFLYGIQDTKPLKWRYPQIDSI